ncbi:hypothetical protein D3C72_1352480 [compost metagenome]
MAHEQQGATLHEIAQKAHAFLGEHGIAHSQCLVHHQNVGIHMGDHGKGEAHIHAAGIGLDRLLHEFTDIGKRRNRVEALGDLRVRQPQQRCIHVDIVAARKLGVEASPQLQQRRNAAVRAHLAAGWLQRAAHHLQQGGFAGTIAPDDADRLALAHTQVQVVQRPEFAVVVLRRTPHHARQARQHKLPQPVARPVVDVETLAQTVDLERHRFRGHRQILCASSGTRQSPARPRWHRPLR